MKLGVFFGNHVGYKILGFIALWFIHRPSPKKVYPFAHSFQRSALIGDSTREIPFARLSLKEKRAKKKSIISPWFVIP